MCRGEGKIRRRETNRAQMLISRGSETREQEPTEQKASIAECAFSLKNVVRHWSVVPRNVSRWILKRIIGDTNVQCG